MSTYATGEVLGRDPVGVVLEGRYRIDSVLGRGGMGSVYLASDLRIGRTVVVKIPHAELLMAGQFRERFEREIASLVSVDHPGIVKILDAGLDHGVPYMILQYLPGGSLQSRLAEGGRCGVEEVSAWISPIARALDFIHRRGVVHRDVKPGNILFDGEGHAFLADFGIAKILAGSAATATRGTTLTAVVGSPPYMAPETLEHAPGPASDQYALGVVVYEALCGSFPHESTTPIGLLVKKATEPPRPLGEVAPGLPSPVVSVVMRTLAADPSARFESCAEFAAAMCGRAAGELEEIAPTAPVAEPGPGPGPAQAPARIVAATSGRSPALLIFLAAALALGFWMAAVAVLRWNRREADGPRRKVDPKLDRPVSRVEPVRPPREVETDRPPPKVEPDLPREPVDPRTSWNLRQAMSARPGWRFGLKSEMSLRSRTFFRSGFGESPLADESSGLLFECEAEVLEVRDGSPTRLSISILRARTTLAGVAHDLGLAGRRIRVDRRGAVPEFDVEEGGRLDEEGEEFLDALYTESPSGRFFERLVRDEPVARGDAWAFSGRDFGGWIPGMTVGPSRSEGRAQFDSIESRHEKDCAVVTYGLALAVTGMPPMEVSDGELSISGRLTVPLDGSIPLLESSMEIESKVEGRVFYGGEWVDIRIEQTGRGGDSSWPLGK